MSFFSSVIKGICPAATIATAKIESANVSSTNYLSSSTESIAKNSSSSSDLASVSSGCPSNSVLQAKWDAAHGGSSAGRPADSVLQRSWSNNKTAQETSSRSQARSTFHSFFSGMNIFRGFGRFFS